MNELDVLRSVNFDWTRQLRSIWRDPSYHVPAIHQSLLDELVDYFARNTSNPDPPDEPLGRVVVGPAGHGKTHLVGELRRRVWERDGWFVLLDLVGVKDFWPSVALGFLSSLQTRTSDGKTQYDRLFAKLSSFLGIDQDVVDTAIRFREQPRELVTALIKLFLQSLSRRYRDETITHRYVITALILLVSDDLDYQSIAHAWLQGMDLESDEVRPLGFMGKNDPVKVVEGLSWVMSLVGPTLIAIDQIDAIVSASNSRLRGADGGARAELDEAQSIVEDLALGLMSLHEKKRRAVTVIACLEATWKILHDKATTAVTARYTSPSTLPPLLNHELAKALIAARIDEAYHTHQFQPRYPTWPFSDAAFESAVGFSPRELLRACEAHRLRCVADSRVSECTTLAAASNEPSPPPDRQSHEFERAYADEIKAASVGGLAEPEGEELFRELLDANLRLLQWHFDLPGDIDTDVQRDPDQKRPSLHGRLSFTFHAEGDREQHYCFRILGHANAIAFQARLKAAMTASGIDRALKFRHLFILRRDPPPGGAKTASLVKLFATLGGKFIAPSDEDLRRFIALQAVARRHPSGMESWLRTRKPLFETSFFKEAGLAPPAFLSAPPPGGQGGSGANATSKSMAAESVQTPRESQTRSDANDHGSAPTEAREAPAPRPTGTEADAPGSILLGRRFERGEFGDPVELSTDLLPRHVAILAGSGSGKTVLLRRIVEEAVLLGIPSIVLDINNDLSRLGEPWPTRPESFDADDVSKAVRYHERADVIIWTPGVSSGNPLSLKLLPDFAAIGGGHDAETEDERTQAVELARATLAPFLGGSGQKATLKQGVLADALRAFAFKGGDLSDLIRLLSELPEEASQIGNAQKLATEIANQLLATIATNPLLKSSGASLDPERLFRGPGGKTRVSVINLSGLASDETRQFFVNQLQMTLFTWIKQHPSSTGRLYVLDEAQNFAPSQAGTACKASVRALAAQARKYGLGMIFATQLPKGIDNAIVSNCTTHVYGRMSSPATIEAAKELMAAKGGAADDIGRLTRGEFYFSTENYVRPVKVRTRVCLSYHPANPPTAAEVIRKARETRQ